MLHLVLVEFSLSLSPFCSFSLGSLNSVRFHVCGHQINQRSKIITSCKIMPGEHNVHCSNVVCERGGMQLMKKRRKKVTSVDFCFCFCLFHFRVCKRLSGRNEARKHKLLNCLYVFVCTWLASFIVCRIVCVLMLRLLFIST